MAREVNCTAYTIPAGECAVIVTPAYCVEKETAGAHEMEITFRMKVATVDGTPLKQGGAHILIEALRGASREIERHFTDTVNTYDRLHAAGIVGGAD